jgi:acyl-CoA reductase-like NAD-dependent aldehyde dehydrogenase
MMNKFNISEEFAGEVRSGLQDHMPTTLRFGAGTMRITRKFMVVTVLVVEHVNSLIEDATDEADAIRLANDSEYGLSAAVFTRDTARGLRVARQTRSGMCHINGPTVHDEAQMPFGGVGASGYGRFGGKAGIDQFTELRWITIETQPGHFPI